MLESQSIEELSEEGRLKLIDNKVTRDEISDHTTYG